MKLRDAALVLLCYKPGTFILSFLALMNTGQYVEVMNNRQPDFSRQLGRLQAYLEGLTRAAGTPIALFPSRTTRKAYCSR